jgi:hypothetical protein
MFERELGAFSKRGTIAPDIEGRTLERFSNFSSNSTVIKTCRGDLNAVSLEPLGPSVHGRKVQSSGLHRQGSLNS